MDSPQVTSGEAPSFQEAFLNFMPKRDAKVITKAPPSGEAPSDDLKDIDPTRIGQTFLVEPGQLKLKSPFKLMIAGKSGKQLTYSEKNMNV
jgi:hypothetical protein